MRAFRHTTGRAMTLVEVLAVMSIILILAGALTGGAAMMLRRGQYRATENLLDALANGLELYRQDHGMYVPGRTDGPEPADRRTTSVKLWQALEKEGDYVDMAGRFKHLHERAWDGATGGDMDYYMYRDAWQRELYYECEMPWRSYELRSAGPDRTFGTDADLVRRPQ